MSKTRVQQVGAVAGGVQPAGRTRLSGTNLTDQRQIFAEGLYEAAAVGDALPETGEVCEK